MDLSIDEIAQLVGGTVIGDGRLRVRGLNALQHAQSGELTFYSGAKYAEQFAHTNASAVFVPPDVAEGPAALIQVANPYAAFAQMLQRYESEALKHPAGVHPAAVVDPSAEIGQDAAIGANATIEAGSIVGPRTVIYSGAYVGRDAVIGADCVVYPNAVIRERCVLGQRCIIHSNATIGGDGFGFVVMDGKRIKIPQVGNVVLGDDVEIGANTSIDRATAGSTRIGTGTKIDSQVQVGHNTHIGEHCAISGCCAIAGSATIGNNVTVGGLSGIGGHIEVGDNVVVGGRSGVTGSVPAGSTVSDFPATDHSKVRRYLSSKFRVPEALKRLRQLEKRMDKLEQK